MRYNNRATSIVESLTVMLIVVTWVVWMYKIFIESSKLSNVTKNRIEAIQIAREWIEAMINIRNTNWILYATDYKNCWNTINYNSNCILEETDTTSTDLEETDTTSTDIVPWSYIIYKGSYDDSYDRWIISKKSTGLYSGSGYRDDFKVTKDNDGFYTQTWWAPFRPLFTREIIINYEDTDNDLSINSDDEKMKIRSLVQWSNANKIHKVELETALTNWKDRK